MYSDNQTEVEIGICCFCGYDCNIHSQSCGSCSRSLSGYSIGINNLPNYLEEKQKVSFEVDKELSKLEEKVWIGDIKCVLPKKLWKCFIDEQLDEGTVTVTDENCNQYFFLYWSSFEDKIYIKNNDQEIGKFPLISGMIGVIPNSSLKMMNIEPLELEMGMFVNMNECIYPKINKGVFQCGTIKIEYKNEI